MPKYRKKPVVIDAAHYEGAGNFANHIVPPWIWEAIGDGIISPAADGASFIVQTLEGPLTASPGDWIIRGVQGEMYPCKPDVFEATYDPVPCSYCAGSGWSAMAPETAGFCGSCNCACPCACGCPSCGCSAPSQETARSEAVNHAH